MFLSGEPAIYDSKDAPRVTCELCEAGFRRVNGSHWGCRCPHLHSPHLNSPCQRLFAAYVQNDGNEAWMAYVDGAPIRTKRGDPRLYSSPEKAYLAAIHGAPKLWHEHEPGHVDDLRWSRPPPRAGTANASVLEILDVPRDFPWLTARDIAQLAADRGTPIKTSTVAAALANLECSDLVEVNRTRSPLRYRRGSGEIRKKTKPKIGAAIAATASASTCRYCDQGFRRVDGIHVGSQRLGMITNTPCDRVFAACISGDGTKRPWLACVDGFLLYKKNGNPRRFSSAASACEAACKEAPKRWHE